MASRRADVAEFVLAVRFDDLPGAVVHQARRCLLDLLSVAAAGSVTQLSHIAREHAVRHFGAAGAGARLLFDGRRASPVGAALAGGMTIDSIDGHDGHALAKGHAGAALLPSVLAYVDDGIAVSGRELLTVLVVGYEVATRAGIALHATAADYHSSGAWTALASAAVGARLLGLDRAATAHAVGIAEYHGPRSPMMRCIDHPTMLKDGAGWGAMTGVDAAYLAASGFTGAPAELLADGSAVRDIWADLGDRWRVLEQYLKPYPVCRWAHPAIDAALACRPAAPTLVERIEVETFAQALRLANRQPAATEQAQYSLPFCVATAVVHGDVGVRRIDGAGLRDREVARLSASMDLRERAADSARFPARRGARVTLVLRDGRRVSATATSAKGDPNDPLSDAEVETKFHGLAAPVLTAARAAEVGAAVHALPEAGAPAGLLLDAVLRPPPHLPAAQP